MLVAACDPAAERIARYRRRSTSGLAEVRLSPAPTGQPEVQLPDVAVGGGVHDVLVVVINPAAERAPRPSRSGARGHGEIVVLPASAPEPEVELMGVQVRGDICDVLILLVHPAGQRGPSYGRRRTGGGGEVALLPTTPSEREVQLV